MKLENLFYANPEHTTINMIKDGVTYSIPCAVGNTEYDQIIKEKL